MDLLPEIFRDSIFQSMILSPIMGLIFAALFAGLNKRPASEASFHSACYYTTNKRNICYESHRAPWPRSKWWRRRGGYSSRRSNRAVFSSVEIFNIRRCHTLLYWRFSCNRDQLQYLFYDFVVFERAVYVWWVVVLYHKSIFNIAVLFLPAFIGGFVVLT